MVGDFRRHRESIIDGVCIRRGVTLIRQGLFVDIEDEGGWDVSDVGVGSFLLVIIDALEVVLEQLLSQSCISSCIL